MSTPYGGAQAPASSKATMALVAGIASLVCCQLVGPVAWYLGSAELNEIQAGQSSRAGEGSAQAGKVLGIISTALSLLGCCGGLVWVLFFGGLAVLQGLNH